MLKYVFLLGILLTFAATLESRAEDSKDSKESKESKDSKELDAAFERSKLAAETAKLFAETQKLLADGRRSFFELNKVRSETALNFADTRQSLAKTALAYAEARRTDAEAIETIAEARLKEALRMEALARVQNLWLHTRITDYEFQRLIKGDLELARQSAELKRHLDIVVSLIDGRASWKTWQALSFLMRNTGASEFIQNVMFATKVPPLKFDGNFKSNDRNEVLHEGQDFAGGNLGSLVNFCKKYDFSFEPYGEAHEQVLKIVTFVKPAADLSLDKLRQLNQSLRLTIASFK